MPGETLVEIFLLDFEDGDVESGCGCDLCDPRTHQAATENTDLFDFHTASFNSPQRRGVTEKISES